MEDLKGYIEEAMQFIEKTNSIEKSI